MRTATVPAQVTTIEDTLIGSLSLQQLIILISPLFECFLLYLILPPSFSIALYKVLIALGSALVICPLALRVKGHLIFMWLLIFNTYRQRPRYYVYDKNSFSFRMSVDIASPDLPESIPPTYSTSSPPVGLSLEEQLHTLRLLQTSYTPLSIHIDKKGIFHASFEESYPQRFKSKSNSN